MKHIIAISGSLRRDSYNTALLHTAKDLSSNTCRLEIASIASIPLYNYDDEQEHGVPDVVEALKNKIASSDGLLISTPEYNHSIPGVLKNVLDWLTRPPKDIKRVFHGRKVGLIGVSAGPLGTRFSQTAWLPILRYLKVRPYWGEQLFVAKANQSFNEHGNCVDEELRELLTRYMCGFINF